MKWQDISVDIKTSSPGGCLPLLMNIYCIKSDFKEIFWNLQHMAEVTRGFCLTSKFCPQGVVSPCPGAVYMYKIMKKIV